MKHALRARTTLSLAVVGIAPLIVPAAINVLNSPPIQAQAQPAKALAFEAA